MIKYLCLLIFCASTFCVNAETVIGKSSGAKYIEYGLVGMATQKASKKLAVAAQLNAKNDAQAGTGMAFGAATEAWNSPTGTATTHLIGLEASVISQNPDNMHGAKVGVAINIKNRPDNARAPARYGNNAFNWWSRAIQINAGTSSSLGETLGWNTGIDFRERSLAGMVGREPIAIDMSRIQSDYAILRARDRATGAVCRVYIDNGEIRAVCE